MILKDLVAIFSANNLDSRPCRFFSPWHALPVFARGGDPLLNWLMGHIEQDSSISIGIQVAPCLKRKMKYCFDFPCNLVIYLTCGALDFNQQRLRFCMWYADASWIVFRESELLEIGLFHAYVLTLTGGWTTWDREVITWTCDWY